MSERLFDRPMRRDPVVRVWAGLMVLTALLVVPQYVEWGEPYNPDRAGELVGVLLLLALLLWCLLFVPAALRRSGRRATRRGLHSAAPTAGATPSGWDVRRSTSRTPSVPPVPVQVPVHTVPPAWIGPEPVATLLVDDLPRSSPEEGRGAVHLDLRPLGELKMLTVAGRTVREGEPVRLDWDFTDADRVLVDGVEHGVRGGCYTVVNASRDVLVQGFQGDRLLHSVRVPVVVVADEPDPEPVDWFGAPAAALETVVSERGERRRDSERLRARAEQRQRALSDAEARLALDAAQRAATSTTSRRAARRAARRRTKETAHA